MKKVLITGATGMVGRQALLALLDHTEVAKVISIGRRKSDISHDKLEQLIHTDFLDFSSLKDEFKDLDACIYCLATYQSKVSAEDYLKITVDYLQALVNSLETIDQGLSFALFSASGADETEKSSMSFATVKGKAENVLHSANFARKYIFRPGYIHPTTTKIPPGLMYKLFAGKIGTSLLKIFPSLGSTDKELGLVMVNTAIKSEVPSQVFENKNIRQMIIALS